METTGIQYLEVLGSILKRPVAPFILKILYHSQQARSREELLKQLASKLTRHNYAMPPEARIDDDLSFLVKANLLVLEPQVSLTDDGRKAARDLFKEAAATTSK